MCTLSQITLTHSGARGSLRSPFHHIICDGTKRYMVSILKCLLEKFASPWTKQYRNMLSFHYRELNNVLFLNKWSPATWICISVFSFDVIECVTLYISIQITLIYHKQFRLQTVLCRLTEVT